jgi:hypothetical protein
MGMHGQIISFMPTPGYTTMIMLFRQLSTSRLATWRMIVAAFIVVACASPSQASVILEARDTIFIDGTLDSEALTAFKTLFTEDITTVAVRSGRGEQVIAGEIGRIIGSRDIRMVILDYCMGPCANYIFTSARHHTVLPLSIVPFHYTGTMITRFVAGIDQKRLKAEYRSIADNEAPHFDRLGPRAILLLESNLETGGDCYVPHRSDDGQFDDIGFRGHTNQWIPSLRYLEALGIYIDGYWPESQADLWATYQSIYPLDTRTSIMMGDGDTPMTMDSATNEISRLPDCSEVNQKSGFPLIPQGGQSP